MSVSDQLLVLVDPVARHHDGESVRIAKDVLSAGAGLKVCLPNNPEEFARSLARRGNRRPVVIGDDHALLRTVTLLHRERVLATTVLSLVPIGHEVSLAKSLGVPTEAVGAARTVLEGAGRRLDLLVDDSDGVVLGGLRIPCGDGTPAVAAGGGPLRALLARVRGGGAGAWGTGAAGARARGRGQDRGRVQGRVRVEVDGRTVVDLGEVVESVGVTPGEGGLCEVEVRWADAGVGARVRRARGRVVSVSGADFRYYVDAVASGPVRRRTWSCRPGGWSLTLPGG
ncbi:diacylglycerol kinase [Streptomyces sp. NPDC059816]|uniref:diacylglycerol kinase n=1 Tax=Streptomyces sp. NPDC059816 TaxID=3346960 RepID=UPI003656A815